MTPNADYGAGQIENAIGDALAAGDVTAAVDLVRLLVTVDVERADLVLRTIALGIALASPDDGSRPYGTDCDCPRGPSNHLHAVHATDCATKRRISPNDGSGA